MITLRRLAALFRRGRHSETPRRDAAEAALERLRLPAASPAVRVPDALAAADPMAWLAAAAWADLEIATDEIRERLGPIYGPELTSRLIAECAPDGEGQVRATDFTAAVRRRAAAALASSPVHGTMH